MTAITRREEAHQRFEREQQAYWAMREQLLNQHFGKWVAVVNGQVAAIGNEMGKAMAEAFRKTQSKVMFVDEVGNEDRVFRIRLHAKRSAKLRKQVNAFLWDLMEQEAEEDMKAGRISGPFTTAEELLCDLKNKKRRTPT